MVSFLETIRDRIRQAESEKVEQSNLQTVPPEISRQPEAPLPVVTQQTIEEQLQWAKETKVTCYHYRSTSQPPSNHEVEPIALTLKVYSQLTYGDAVRLGQEIIEMFEPLSRDRLRALPHLELDKSGILFMLRPNIILVTAELTTRDPQGTKIIGFLIFGESLKSEDTQSVVLEPLAVVSPCYQHHGITYAMACRALEQAQKKYDTYILEATTIGGYQTLELLRDRLFTGVPYENSVTNGVSSFRVRIQADWKCPASTHLEPCDNDAQSTSL